MKFALIAPLAFGLLAAASPTDISQCTTGKQRISHKLYNFTDYSRNSGSALCCNTAADAQSSVITSLLSPLGIVLSGITGLVGLGCTPITIVGVGQGANCAQQPICCTGNRFNGLVNIGCTSLSG
ncbi:hypothetical protein M422DRAFT_262333 [Sphaerobolus stellatus SS14]|uniref:Hydrophobin n=1 Tax=Sphaerobolus stellatus (strain SS14) TaxID=990650 RepID=A0A0C9TY17_SPHS4|nr:hypothetical protein M422DRAFT_262333 [Sphaerobolus stellatus SS14]